MLKKYIFCFKGALDVLTYKTVLSLFYFYYPYFTYNYK